MNLIGLQNGMVALRAPTEQSGGIDNVPLGEAIAAVAERFHFRSVPAIANVPINGNPTPISSLTFQYGGLEIDKGRAGITHLTISVEGLIATCRRTDTADAVITAFCDMFDSTFGTRYGQIADERLYVSALVAQFENRLAAGIATISQIAREVTKSVNMRDRRLTEPFHLNRVSFSQEPGQVQLDNPFEAMRHQEFIMEARVEYPLSDGVFFCVAPLPTGEHLALLERLEKIAT